jgi:hypothetical protein
LQLSGHVGSHKDRPGKGKQADQQADHCMPWQSKRMTCVMDFWGTDIAIMIAYPECAVTSRVIAMSSILTYSRSCTLGQMTSAGPDASTLTFMCISADQECSQCSSVEAAIEHPPPGQEQQKSDHDGGCAAGGWQHIDAVADEGQQVDTVTLVSVLLCFTHRI